MVSVNVHFSSIPRAILSKNADTLSASKQDKMFLFPGPSKIFLTTRIMLKRPGGTGSHFPTLATGKPSDKIQGIHFFSTIQPVLEKHDATPAWNTGPPKIQHQLTETRGPVFFLKIRSNPELPLLKGFDRQVQPFQKQFLT